MKKLAPLPRFFTIGPAEQMAVIESMNKPMSGYLGGIHRGGYWVEKLAETWAGTFGVRHAIPCNSATSGLLAACMAANIEVGDTVWVSNYTMSATAACAAILGAQVKLLDIDVRYLQINPLELVGRNNEALPKAVIVTNLHGHPAELLEIKRWCDARKVIMIEDNAQSPFAKEGARYAGTVGHIGVFSLNVHKHIQCGEGGIIVTNSDDLAEACRAAINHGELGNPKRDAGLNLRMTEPIAAIALTQLMRAPTIIDSRVALAQQLTEIIKDIPWLLPPFERFGCKHVYYMWCARIDKDYRNRRNLFAALLNEAGVPIGMGYSRLDKIFGYNDQFVATDDVDSRLLTFEVCAYDPSVAHLKDMRDIIHEIAGKIHGYQAEIRRGLDAQGIETRPDAQPARG